MAREAASSNGTDTTDSSSPVPAAVLSLTADMIDQVLVDRLMESPVMDYPQPPLHYLLACYTRASNELRTPAVAGSTQLSAAAQAVKELAVNYVSLLLCGGGLIPQVGGSVGTQVMIDCGGVGWCVWLDLHASTPSMKLVLHCRLQCLKLANRK